MLSINEYMGFNTIFSKGRKITLFTSIPLIWMYLLNVDINECRAKVFRTKMKILCRMKIQTIILDLVNVITFLKNVTNRKE